MENTARLFNCLLCHTQVRICQGCDRGNIYCNSICSRLARFRSVREAGKRYQKSRQGKFKHAARQRRYRARKKIVTHHSSQESVVHHSLPITNDVKESTPIIQCDFCGKLCSPWMRLDFLNDHSFVSTDLICIWPRGS